MGSLQISTADLRGICFDIADLLLIGDWSQACGLRMVVRPDYGSKAGEYEEVLAFHPAMGGPSRWMMWRDEAAVFVQPLPGRPWRHGCISEAIEALTPPLGVVVTDIVASHWPG